MVYLLFLISLLLPCTMSTTVPWIPSSSVVGQRGRSLSNDNPKVVAAILGIHRRKSNKRVVLVDHDGEDDEEEGEELNVQRPKKRKRKRGSIWPPWPFNLLQPKPETPVAPAGDDRYDVHFERNYRSAPSLMWLFARESTRITLDKLRHVASHLWFHLPPGMPPFVLCAMVPRTIQQTATATTTITTAESVSVGTVKRVIPLLSNPFVRSVALSGLGLSIMSWAHYEIHRKRCLTPLPLAAPYRDLYKTVLPPFLPEEIPSSWMDGEMIRDENSGDDEDEMIERTKKPGSMTTSVPLPPTLQRQVNSILGKAPSRRSLRSMLKEYQRMRIRQQSERRRAHRLSIQDQLLAIQALKNRASKRRKRPSHRKSKATTDDPTDQVGYALVTGASRGIGRAIAVELARYEIPVILIARDVDRLTALAYDLESYYGIRCFVVQADLSKPGEAEKVHRATSAAGLQVDILVNNAGYSLQGESVEFSVQQTNDLIQLNALSLSSLTHLYGRDMKNRRRGRILMMSSICGATAGIPTVAVYTATKAFVNALSLGIGQEMEPYGVGVTCIMPGAVKDTEFKSRSDSDQALCWKIPFYPKTPQRIAEQGVKALLRGETESTPGWENRFFLKVLKPAVPQRIHNIIAETFWNPVRWPFSKKLSHEAAERRNVVQPFHSEKRTGVPPPPPFQPSQRIPRLLIIRDDEEPVDSQLSEERQREEGAANDSEEEEEEGDKVAKQEKAPRPKSDDELKSEHLQRDGKSSQQEEFDPSVEEFEPSWEPTVERESDSLSKQSARKASSLPPIASFGQATPLADAEAERFSRRLQASGSS